MLSREAANQNRPVALHAVVTYCRHEDGMFFVQDATGGIYVDTRQDCSNFPRGTKVAIRGITVSSFSTDLRSDDIRNEGRAELPRPVATNFRDLIAGRNDCSYVTVSGSVLAATLQTPAEVPPFLLIEMRLAGGSIEAHVRLPGNLRPEDLVDDEIQVTGVAGGTFDGKYEMVGSKLYVESAADVKVLRHIRRAVEDLPVTHMDRVIAGYNMPELSERARVRGVVTYYQPGSELVLQDGKRSILVHTHQGTPLALGQVVDAIGFPNTSDYAPSLRHAQIFKTGLKETVKAEPVTFDQAMLGLHSFDLVSMTGSLIAQVHDTRRDTLVLDVDHHLTTVVLELAPGAASLPLYQLGSELEVTGVCFLQAESVWNTAISFNIRMRTPQDVVVERLPSWWTVRHLVGVSVALLLVIGIVLCWVILLRRRVARQTSIIRSAAEAEAARERRDAAIEKERSLVLEAINSSQPLRSVLQLIAHFVERQIAGVTCTFQLSDMRIPKRSDDGDAEGAPLKQSLPTVERLIRSSDGILLGSMRLTFSQAEPESESIRELTEMACRLAALAIDNRRLHETLVHRSEYDQLTGVPNRFLFETRFEQAINEAKRNGEMVALLYLDLDDFKSVNDRYGHRTGDLFLQQVARRLSSKLRNQDLLARIGGDEFLCIVPNIAGKEEAECIAERLAYSFEHPFVIDGETLRGSVSIGIATFPSDGENGEDLKRAADSAMYLRKQAAH